MMNKWFLAGALIGLVTLVPPSLEAQDDTSADAPGGFAATVARSDAVIIRVPVRENGDELTSAAEVRLYEGAQPGEAGIRSAFERGTSAAGQQQITAGDIQRDSSTSGWCRYDYGGWRYNYYQSYQPYYYNSGRYWYYGNPYSYSFYYPSSYSWGYRYYYYPSYW